MYKAAHSKMRRSTYRIAKSRTQHCHTRISFSQFTPSRERKGVRELVKSEGEEA